MENKPISRIFVVAVILATITLAIVLSQCGHEKRTDADPAHMQPRDNASAY